MAKLFNLDKKFNQEDIASLLYISSRQVRNLMQQGFLPQAKGRDGIDPLACIHAYITYKSKSRNSKEKAETDADEEEEFDKIENKLKLEDKRESIAMKRAKRMLFEKTYGPLDIISDVLQQVGGNLATIHDGLISKMKLAWPDMPVEAVEVLTNELTAAANECSEITPDLSDYTDGDPEDGPAWIVGDEESASSIGP
ncbi:hypothetical protein [Shewanella surugensis]|uniref:Terminase small subunit n=1 Tax=Shewanella surugensis TaxID=212020 RepID=A0ABT0L8W8_9GAMM|nr:hypothetical protein [Shewanella surugensis]MCL1124148.1 hypothetical protein [Shewanella surugensis]